MLVLTRRIDEKLIIGHQVQLEIIILKIQGKSVRLGIQADKSISIWRHELMDMISPERFN